MQPLPQNGQWEVFGGCGRDKEDTQRTTATATMWQHLAQSNLVICVETIRESYNSFWAKYRRARGTIQTYLGRFSVRKYLNYWSSINKVNTTYWNLIFDQPWVKNSCFFPVLKYRRITSVYQTQSTRARVERRHSTSLDGAPSRAAFIQEVDVDGISSNGFWDPFGRRIKLW